MHRLFDTSDTSTISYTQADVNGTGSSTVPREIQTIQIKRTTATHGAALLPVPALMPGRIIPLVVRSIPPFSDA